MKKTERKGIKKKTEQTTFWSNDLSYVNLNIANIGLLLFIIQSNTWKKYEIVVREKEMEKK